MLDEENPSTAGRRGVHRPDADTTTEPRVSLAGDSPPYAARPIGNA